MDGENCDANELSVARQVRRHENAIWPDDQVMRTLVFETWRLFEYLTPTASPPPLSPTLTPHKAHSSTVPQFHSTILKLPLPIAGDHTLFLENDV